ncbi:hypothetical protein LSTR_LSTR011754 [Laodelphax striatellus]|uniref:HTH CENPB-type domain-containing protein n=1 Tax=Laodelphax striatellus TaxID=195883 RepID=A0A482WMR3_LAOST|nr:hypothetical protein LSTR_LSTR011754 [Laodelphax striatellus]
MINRNEWHFILASSCTSIEQTISKFVFLLLLTHRLLLSSFAGLIDKTMMKSMKRKTLSVSEKLKIIREIENGKSKAYVCRTYNLPNSTVSTIWKNREKLRIAFEQNKLHVKKIRLCDKNDLDEALVAWLKINSSGKMGVSIPINGTVLKVMAEKLAENLGYKGFVCGNGWISRFKARHRVIYGMPNVEESSTTDCCNEEDLADNWLEFQWPMMKPGFDQCDIFSAVETGLLYRLTPDQLSELNGGQHIGGVSPNNRLTIFLCANMTGSEKRKPLVIGKKLDPSCFKNIKNLPVTYVADPKVWMTSEIFETELRKWDSELSEARRTILLLVDDCLAHSIPENFSNIKLQFIPASAAEKIQPLSQGVTHRFKVNYRRFMLMEMLDEQCNASRLNVLDAIRLIDRAWYCVSSNTIRDSFIRSGLAGSVRKLESDEEISLADWVKLIDSKGIFQNYKMDDYVAADDFLLTTETTMYNFFSSELQDSGSECEDEDLSTCDNPVISVREAKDSLLTLTKFSETNAVSEEFSKQLNQLKTSLDMFMLKITH